MKGLGTGPAGPALGWKMRGSAGQRYGWTRQQPVNEHDHEQVHGNVTV